MRIGDYTSSGDPTRRLNEGFVFISAVGGPVEIRYPQWFVEMGAVILIGAIAIFATREKG
jgi:hypothetical protein